MPKRFKTERANILLAFGATLVCLLFLEIGTRVVAHLENQGRLGGSPDQGVEIPHDRPAELGHLIRLSTNRRIVYELKPDLSVTYQGAPLTTDSLGFRSDAPESPSSEDRQHLVGIGDSFMFGYGVEGRQSYLAILESMLNERSPKPGYRIVNTAVPGYNTVMEVETLKEKGLAFNPRVVVIGFVENDLSLPNFIRADKPVWTLRRSLFVDLVKHRLGLFRHKSLWRRLQIAGLQGVPPDDSTGSGSTADPSVVPEKYRDLVGWDAYTQSMTELRDLGDQQGFEVVSLFLAPFDGELKMRAMELSAELGFQVLDVGAIFQTYIEANGFTDYLASPLALSPTDGHPSALGHQITAEALFDFLVGKD